MDRSPRWVFDRTDGEAFVRTGIVRSQYVYQSALGRFFVGRTGVFDLPAGQEGLVTLENPTGSRKDVFIQAVTVTSDRGRRAIFWFDVETLVQLAASDKLANVHRGSLVLPVSRILFGAAASIPKRAGFDLFERLLVGRQTLLLDQEGKFILDPGHNHSVGLPSIDDDDEIDVAFAWWEEPMG